MRRTTHLQCRMLIAILGKGIWGKQMAVVNIHVRPKQDHGADTSRSGWFVGRPNPTTSKFWLTGIAFLVLYSILNKLTAY
jgi:hypothetical protein